MSFYGRITEAPEARPLRTFTWTTATGERDEVKASYVSFMPDHVSFWLETDNEWDTLVLAEWNQNVTHMKEVTA